MSDSFYKQQTEPQLTGKTPSIPSYIGPYKIESLLNKGGMSWLYLGIDPKTKTPLAIKTLPSSYLDDQEVSERFSKESQLIALTNHPNIVKLYGEGKWEKGLYIATEWIHGISLRQFLNQHSFSLKRSLEIILQVCYALEHLHLHGVIHRDLKPENILIEESGAVKVIDFGIAETTQNTKAKKSTNVLGTPSYMSPEQKENISQATFASDIYSLGVIAYELITGKPSFGMVQLSFVPKELRKILEKALAVSVSERYQSVSELIKDLVDYLGSDAFEKEKSGQDAAKELIEIFQKASFSLNPFPSPTWSFADIGIAKTSAPLSFGLYYDAFKVSQDHFLFVIATPTKQNYLSLFTASILKGMIQAFMQTSSKRDFKPFSLIEFLHENFESNPQFKDFAFSYVYLDSTQDQVSFFGAGINHLLYIPEGSDPTFLENHHTLLSESPLSEFSETISNWSLGDTLIFQSMILDDHSSEKTMKTKENLLKLAEESTVFSAQPQAEHFLKDFNSSSLFGAKDSQVVFSIQRIS